MFKDMEERIRRQTDKALKDLMSPVGQAEARAAAMTAQTIGETRESTMQRISLPPTLGDNLRAMFGADKTIGAIADEIEAWKQDLPDDKHLVVMLKTPDNRMMDVAVIKANGWQGFIAEGYIEGMPCFVAGHIATLSLFCCFEETKSRTPVGFRIVAEPPIEPQTEPAPPVSDKS